VGDLEADFGHAFDDGGGGRCGGDEPGHAVVDAFTPFGRRIGQHGMDDGGAAVVGHLVFPDGLQDQLGIDPAQTDVGAGIGRHGPGEAPAVAVEHGQGPQVHRMGRHAPGDDVGHGVEVGAPVVVDHALGVAGGAGGVVEGDGVPFVLGALPLVIRGAFGQQGLVVLLAQQVAGAGVFAVVHVDDDDAAAQLFQGRPDDVGILLVGDEDLGLAVVQHEGHGFRIETGVEGVEHGTGDGHAEVAFVHFRRVVEHHGDGVAFLDAPGFQGGGQAPGAVEGFQPGIAALAVDHGHPVRVDVGGTGNEG